jgi:hypothetical protein
MAVAMAVVLMLGLEVTVWADEDDDEKAEMRDFVAAVYRGGGYEIGKSILWQDGTTTRRVGNAWISNDGQTLYKIRNYWLETTPRK